MKEKVYAIISRVMNVALDTVNEDSSPDTIEAWDSLSHMNLVLALEEEFNAHFDEQQIIEMMSVGLIIETIREIQGGK